MRFITHTPQTINRGIRLLDTGGGAPAASISTQKGYAFLCVIKGPEFHSLYLPTTYMRKCESGLAEILVV